MAKIETKSLQVKNMNDHNYMVLHKRMYTLSSDGSYKICLVNKDLEIFMEVTEDTFHSFVKYELSFYIMLTIYTALCIKYGKIQIPF